MQENKRVRLYPLTVYTARQWKWNECSDITTTNSQLSIINLFANYSV